MCMCVCFDYVDARRRQPRQPSMCAHVQEQRCTLSADRKTKCVYIKCVAVGTRWLAVMVYSEWTTSETGVWFGSASIVAVRSFIHSHTQRKWIFFFFCFVRDVSIRFGCGQIGVSEVTPSAEFLKCLDEWWYRYDWSRDETHPSFFFFCMAFQ